MLAIVRHSRSVAKIALMVETEVGGGERGLVACKLRLCDAQEEIEKNSGRPRKGRAVRQPESELKNMGMVKVSRMNKRERDKKEGEDKSLTHRV